MSRRVYPQEYVDRLELVIDNLEAQLAINVSMLQKVVDDGGYGVVPASHLNLIRRWLLDSSNKQAHLGAEILRCAEEFVATTHLDMSGKHKYSISYVGQQKIGEAVRARKENDNE